MTSKQILVVDDDAGVLLLIATILRRENYDVATASGGREALSMIALTVYDVIVLDLMMPEVSGLDVLAGLHARVPHVKCVVVVSAGSEFDVAHSVNPNVFVGLQKPFNVAELIDAVGQCIAANCEPAPVAPPLAAAA
jgi:DNA-binding NtrC family response regulator